MRRNAYLDTLRQVPCFRALTDHDLLAIGRLVDTVDVAAGTVLVADRRELVATLTPSRLLVIGRCAAEAVFELSPALRVSAGDAWPSDALLSVRSDDSGRREIGHVDR